VSSKQDPVARLGELVDEQLARWGEPSLADIAAISIQRFPPDDALSSHLEEHRRGLATWLRASIAAGSADDGFVRAPTRDLSRRLASWLQRRNQFLLLDDLAWRKLETLVRRFLTDVAELLEGATPDDRMHHDLSEIFALHRESLASFLREKLGLSPRDVVSAEYSPELQLAILGLDAATLREPILDVGCGSRAALVLHLRSLGLSASGIDRDAPPDVATIADFTAYEYGDAAWGTVVSHLAFSLHFLHHHLAGTPSASLFARAMMSILRSLRVGGVFAYVPALPFFEAVLPSDRYIVTVAALPPHVDRTVIEAVEGATGQSFAATHVRRLA
jgi:hypothetical protein